MRTIRVTGKGQIKVRPDMTRITLSLEGTYPEYGEALRRSSQDTEQLKDLLTGFGFERSDLKTLNFHVDTEYESYKDRGAYKQRFVGYKYHHAMKVEFESDNERLGKVLYALAHSPVRPEFRLSYTVKDPEAAKNELLGKAVTDARAWGQINFEVQPMNRMLMSEECCDSAINEVGSYDMDIEPDDIEVSDTVTVVWEIA